MLKNHSKTVDKLAIKTNNFFWFFETVFAYKKISLQPKKVLNINPKFVNN